MMDWMRAKKSALNQRAPTYAAGAREAGSVFFHSIKHGKLFVKFLNTVVIEKIIKGILLAEPRNLLFGQFIRSGAAMTPRCIFPRKFLGRLSNHMRQYIQTGLRLLKNPNKEISVNHLFIVFKCCRKSARQIIAA